MTDREDARIKYADIIDLPHRQSSSRKRMSLHDRAAQFAPFAALSGYDDMVAEEARLTDREIQLSKYELDILDQKIQMIENAVSRGEHPRVSLTYYKPDMRKAGGTYESMTGIVKKVDTIEKTVIFFGSEVIEDKRVSQIVINMERIIDISKK